VVVVTGWTVGQVARAAGTTVRALHHWESLGLLVPSSRTAAGYRVYDDADLQRLQRLLAYRALDLPLDRVRALLDGEADAGPLLREHAARLREQGQRLVAMADALDRTREARRMGIELTPQEVLEVFGDDDPGRHAEEAEQRWGGTDAWAQSQERTRRYGKDDWLRFRQEQEALLQRMAEALRTGAPADGDVAVALAEEHRQQISTWFYDCSPDMHRDLGRTYVEDPRFTAHYDRVAPGLAQWLHEAIEATAR
jgi:MerR family transcriptional regulator, thiopeptide resistance regulator